MKRVITAAAAMAVVLGVASTASALAVLQVSVNPGFMAGTQTLEIGDSPGVAPGPFGDSNPEVDAITVRVPASTPFNGFSFTAATGTSNEGTLNTELFLNVQDVARTSTGTFDTLYFRFTDNNLTRPGSPGDQMIVSTTGTGNDAVPPGGALPLSVRFQSFGDPNNALFGTTFAFPNTPMNCTFGPVSPGGTAGCGPTTVGGSFPRTGPNYSLTNYLAVQLQQGNSLGNASVSTNVTAQSIPEPGSLLLLGSGLAAASAAARRRRTQKAQA